MPPQAISHRCIRGFNRRVLIELGFIHPELRGILGRPRVNLKACLTEEEGIALGISSTLCLFFKLFPSFELLPQTRWVNVLVPLVPSPINHLGEGRVVIVTLQVFLPWYTK